MAQSVQGQKPPERIFTAMQHEQGGKDRILEAARSLYSRHGFHRTSMAELATSAQISVGQIYRLFKSKEEVINAITETDACKWVDETAQLARRLSAGEIDVETSFESLLLSVVHESDEALSFEILAEGFRNPRVGETIALTCARIREQLSHFALAANPRLSGQALADAEEIILACIFGLGHRSLSRPETSCQSTARSAARMIIAGLRAIA